MTFSRFRSFGKDPSSLTLYFLQVFILLHSNVVTCNITRHNLYSRFLKSGTEQKQQIFCKKKWFLSFFFPVFFKNKATKLEVFKDYWDYDDVTGCNNTDNAWVEVVAVNFHDGTGKYLDHCG